MKGNVIGFDPDTNTGAVSGHDGNRYDFATGDWRGRSQPRHGDVVDFQPEGQRASQIYLMQAEYVQPGFGAFYFSPSGRISRSQYWLKFMLPYFVIVLVLEVLAVAGASSPALAGTVGVILMIFSLVAFWPSIAILVKRIHDRNKSGWLCLALYIPIVLFTILLMVWLAVTVMAVAAGKADAATSIGAFAVIVAIFGLVTGGIGIWFFVEFGCLRGTIGDNRFGPDPVR
jgi:uncharacterized membrane protein YhaH (DUF805 family)